jgi:hypothetical protein
MITGDPARAFLEGTAARALTDRIEHPTTQAKARLLLVAAHAEIGDSDGVEAWASELLALCAHKGFSFDYDRCKPSLAVARLNAGRVRDAIVLLESVVDRPDRQLAVGARARLGHTHVASGDLDAAVREASLALNEGHKA